MFRSIRVVEPRPLLRFFVIFGLNSYLQSSASYFALLDHYWANLQCFGCLFGKNTNAIMLNKYKHNSYLYLIVGNVYKRSILRNIQFCHV